MFRTLAAVALAALIASPAAASRKPCRDPQGRIVPCPQPRKAAPERCKDAQGRFVKCGTPGARPVK